MCDHASYQPCPKTMAQKEHDELCNHLQEMDNLITRAMREDAWRER